MRDFPTDAELAISRAQWGPDLKQFASRSSAILRQARRLAIRDAAIAHASQWLYRSGILNAKIPNGYMLLLIGDEHLEQACWDTLPFLGVEYEFIYRVAFFEWLRRNACSGFHGWWVPGSWSINDPLDLLELVTHLEPGLQLTANETYLCTESFDCRGTHSICRLEDGKLSCRIVSEWVDSV